MYTQSSYIKSVVYEVIRTNSSSFKKNFGKIKNTKQLKAD